MVAIELAGKPYENEAMTEVTTNTEIVAVPDVPERTTELGVGTVGDFHSDHPFSDQSRCSKSSAHFG